MDYDKGRFVEYQSMTDSELLKVLDMLKIFSTHFELIRDIIIEYNAHQKLWFGTIYGTRKEL